MILLRFEQGLAPSAAAVLLRFVTAEPIPPWPILKPTVLSAKQVGFGGQALGYAGALAWQQPVVEAGLYSGYAKALQVRGWSLHSFTSVLALELPSLWGSEQVQVFATSTSLHATALSASSWCRRQANEVFENICPASHTAALFDQQCNLAFVSLALSQQSSLAVWTSEHTHHSLHFPYGPAPATWVCGTTPVGVVGRVSIRFADAQLLRFEVPPQQCQWSEGGGYKQAHDVVPVIDFVIPIEPVWRRSYLMQPTVTCERLSDGQVIAICDISICKRRGNFAKAFSVTFQSNIDLQRARNQPLKVVINGYEYHVLLEQCATSRAFGSSSFHGQGRSLVALLASPYQLPITYANTTDRSLLGVLSDLLQGSGWTVQADGFNDFVIPAGAFSIQGKSMIEAISSQLDGIGIMVAADDLNKELVLRPKWPTVPWQFANQNPAIVFHEGVIQSLSDSEDISPLCNGVHVRGEQVGISAHVKRQGTAGDLTPSDISHPLLVAVTAAQLCGTAALADTGRKRIWQITAPVMATLPVVTEGQLIGIRDEFNQLFKAMVDSWSVTASIAADGAVSVKQSFTALEPLEV